MFSLNDFTKLGLIGEGTYGKVFKAINKITGKLVAIKKIKTTDEETNGLSQTSLREISSLRDLCHPNIVELQLATMKNGALYMIFEFMHCDLRKYLDDINGPMLNAVLQSFLYQIMQGVLFCHLRRLIHRDLKPQNILVDIENMVIKIADFGLARTYGTPIKPLTHEICTLWYRPPEILLGSKRYTCAVDVWSVACIFAEMAVYNVGTRDVPYFVMFKGDSEIGQILEIFKIAGTPSEDDWEALENLLPIHNFPKWQCKITNTMKGHVSDLGIDLIEKMLIHNPAKRCRLSDALTHPYFNDIDRGRLPAHGEELKVCAQATMKHYRK